MNNKKIRITQSAKSKKQESNENNNDQNQIKHETQNNLQKTNTLRPITSQQTIKNSQNVYQVGKVERMQIDKLLEKMNTKINHLKNPRHKFDNKPPIQFNEINKRPELFVDSMDQKCPFMANPQVILFKGYQINEIYQINLKIINKTSILRRIKFIPPQLEEFTISNIIYPGEKDPKELQILKQIKEVGLIAPGMSLQLTVQFKVTSFAQFEDKITFITDDCVFEVPIISQKEQPIINLPEVLNCKSCWVGDKTETIFSIQNKGGEAGFRLFDQNQDGQYEQILDNYTLTTESFLLYPCEFFLHKNESIEVHVTFYPKKEGLIQQQIVLACDNLTNASFLLQGTGNMAELEIFGIDDVQFSSISASQFDFIRQIFFENSFPNTVVTKTLQIKNKTNVNIKYHWAQFKQDSTKVQNDIFSSQEKYYFKIQPQQGFFEKDQIIPFQISYFCETYIPQFEYISLIIEDISIFSIKNPPQIIAKNTQMMNNNLNLQGFDKPSFLASNSSRQSINYFDFQLLGLGQLVKIDVEPPYHIFVGNLLLGKSYFQKFTLKNNSSSIVNFNIQHYQFKYLEPNVYPDIPVSKGTISANSELEITLGFKSFEIGENKKLTFLIEFNHAQPVYIDLIGNFTGPEISFDAPEINFGLLKVGQEGVFKLKIKNESDVEAELLFKDINNAQTFQEIKDTLTLLNNYEIIDENEKKLQNYLDLYKKKNEEYFIFDNPLIYLQPLEEKTVIIRCIQSEAMSLSTILECIVKEGKSKFIMAKAEIQKIHVSLNQFEINFEKLYLNNKYKLIKGQSNQHIELQNLGNVSCSFSWEKDQKQMVGYTFEPQSGILKAKEILPINITFIPQVGGNLDELFVCNIEGMEYPLGFELKSYVQGLTISFDYLHLNTKNQTNNDGGIDLKEMTKQMKNKILNKPKDQDQRERKISISESRINSLYTRETLQGLEYYGCQINQPKTLKISIRNTSEINTTFEILPEKYIPVYSQQEQSVTHTTENKGQESTVKTITSNLSKKNNQKKRQSFSAKPQVLLTDEIEKKNNFTSIQGQQLNQTKILQQNQRIYLSNNKGIAILCEPNKGKLPANSEVLITVTCFNDICGHFKDNLIININGYPQQKFPLVVEVIGSPIIINPGQLGVSYKDDWPCFNLGQFLRDQKIITRQFKIMNTGPKDVVIDWKLYDLQNIDINKDKFQISIVEPHLGTQDACLLHFEPIEPQEIDVSDIKIQEKQIVLHGREEKSIKVSFQSNKTKDFEQMLVANPYLVNNQSQIFVNEKNGMGTVAIKLKAQTINPQLYIDKLKCLDDSQKLKFEKWSCQEDVENKKEHKEITFINKFLLNLRFTINISGPFKITNSNTNSPASYDEQIVPLHQERIEYLSNKFNLVQNSHLTLLIEFQGPKVNNYTDWPLTYKTYKYGVLEINFENGDQQIIDLEGHLLRPLIQLNTSGIEDVEGSSIQDFDEVHINNSKSKEIFLSNMSLVPAKWKINHIKYVQTKNFTQILPNMLTKEDIEDSVKIDDPSVFEFQISQGILKGPSVPIKPMPDTLALPTETINQLITQQQLYAQKILINFRPKKNVLYKCKYRIIVEEGPSVDFVLRGKGTYDERKYK